MCAPFFWVEVTLKERKRNGLNATTGKTEGKIKRVAHESVCTLSYYRREAAACLHPPTHRNTHTQSEATQTRRARGRRLIALSADFLRPGKRKQKKTNKSAAKVWLLFEHKHLQCWRKTRLPFPSTYFETSSPPPPPFLLSPPRV